MSTTNTMGEDYLQQSSNRFDFITNIVNSSLINNQSMQPKIIKMLDTVQTYLDLNNEKLVEHLSKQREHESLELTKKSNDLNHRQKLQSLLIESINDNDLRKANFINTCLHVVCDATNKISNKEPASTPYDIMPIVNDDYNNNINNDYNFEQTETFETSTASSSLSSSNNNNNNNNNNDGYLIDDNYDENLFNNVGTSCATATNSTNSEYINLNDSIRDAFTKAKKSNPLSPIRHLICSPGLELKALNSKIIILYRGKCNGVCYQNKPWSKEMHIHYIINTVNCNDHNQERIKQLIQMYKMEKV